MTKFKQTSNIKIYYNNEPVTTSNCYNYDTNNFTKKEDRKRISEYESGLIQGYMG